MERKSFDIDEQELADAKRRASEAGVSLNRYIRLAVVEKNVGHSVTVDLAAMRGNIDHLIARLDKQSHALRASVSDDVEQSMAAMRQENSEFITRQQELLKQFLLTLGQQLTGQGKTAAGLPPFTAWGSK